MLPQVIRAMNLFADGKGYAGVVEEVTPPKLTLKTFELCFQSQLYLIHFVFWWNRLIEPILFVFGQDTLNLMHSFSHNSLFKGSKPASYRQKIL
ncbi:phage major tail tube protein [Parabacteroides distasonis]|uniref:phage major tail tube protein n=1 Tax=Parabacteroides distasonis TaxID=823 RepID=UPI0027B985BC|nr:phage major tail tube protein [Parabacteroides distasonis]